MSYPLNFGIYCGMSKQFRDTFKELIPISCKRNDINRNNGDIRAVTKNKGPGSHRRSKPQNNLVQAKQVRCFIKRTEFAYILKFFNHTM